MRGVMEKHGKKILAVASGLLMLVFISPLNRGSGTRANPEIGRIGKQVLTQNDADLAKAEWDFMRQQLVVEVRSRDSAEGLEWVPIVSQIRIPRLYDAITKDQRLLMLLTQEAALEGLAPTEAQVDQTAKESGLAVRTRDGRIVPIDDLPDLGEANLARLTLSAFLSLDSLTRNATGIVKVTEPMLQKALALTAQTVTLQTAEFSAKDQMAGVPEPSEQQLKEQFEKYGEIQQPAPVSETNPFGFGYKYAPRVKLQFIEVPMEEVRRVVKASKSDYDWEVAARAFYLKNQKEFATTEPAATQPTEMLSLGAHGPTTRPFAEVKDEAIERVMSPDVDDLAGRLETKIDNILHDDWTANNSGGETGPTTAPAKTGATITSDEYLSNIARRIQTEDGVVCKVERIGQLMDATQLKADASLAQLLEAQTSRGEGVAELASANPAVCQPYQPSDAMHDFVHSTFFVRFSEMRGPERPASIDEVRQRVAHDWKLTQAMARATQRAEDLAKAAKSKGLAEAAAEAGKTGAKIEVMTTTPFMPGGTAPPMLNISPAAQGQFVSGVTHLLTLLALNEKPVAIVPLQADERVMVAEIQQVEPIYTTAEDRFDRVAATNIGLHRDFDRYGALLNGWFDLDHVMSRVHYADEQPVKQAATGPS
jgi:hypothetical protein